VNAIGPVEPGEDTYDGEQQAPPERDRLRRIRVRLHAVRRRSWLLMAAGAGCCALLAGLLVHLTQPPPPPPPPIPWPSQSMSVTYAGAMTHPTRGARRLRFKVSITNESPDHIPVPPVTVLRIAQPSAALSVTTSPRLPLIVKSGTTRTAVITMLIRECAKAPRNAGLPFLEVTLRNTRAKQELSFIPGSAYASDLSAALTAACPQPAVS
jgi:hypothetical protein